MIYNSRASSKHLVRLGVLLVAQALLTCPRAFALRTNPGAIEIGDRGSIVFPIENADDSDAPMENMRVQIVNLPSWFVPRNTSLLGPQEILPGETFSFRIDFQIGSSFSPSNAAVDMEVRIVQTSTDVVPNSWTWRFVSSDGLFTYSGICADDEGRGCGHALAPDSTPPITALVLDGPRFSNPQGGLFLSNNTMIQFASTDSCFVRN